MFTNSGLALFFVVIKLVEGLLIGLVVAALRYRSRLSPRFAVTPMVFQASPSSLCQDWLAGQENMPRFKTAIEWDVAPRGEDLRLRNVIAANELPLCVIVGSVAALLAGIRPGKKRRTASD